MSAPQPTCERPRGSLRRKLWELPVSVQCAVIGMCLPLSALRRLVDKSLGGQALADDYELHMGAVAECACRNRISEALQRELDRRYALVLKRFAAARDVDALGRMWSQALAGPSVAAALWATLTHPACDEVLGERVRRDVYLLQHQLGAGRRAELQRVEQLLDENRVLGRELAALQARSSRQIRDKAQEVDRLIAELMQLRARLIARDTELAAAREEIAALEAATPGLASRLDLARRLDAQIGRAHELERTALIWQQRAQREAERARELAEQLQALGGQPASSTGPLELAAPTLQDKAVLCVGGRPASVPVYRRLIERVGGRFIHHDGFERDGAAQLDSSLSAADLVICQAGCVSHGAYWRVKDYCKRHGKRCVFVDNPSASSLLRCLEEIGTAEGEA